MKNVTKQQLMDAAYKSLKMYNGILIGSLACVLAGTVICGIAAAKAEIEQRKVLKEKYNCETNDTEDE